MAKRATATTLSLLIPAVLGTLAGGCTEDLSDTAFGVLDLSPYYPASAPGQPGLIPPQIEAKIGYVDTKKVEYYEFGAVPVLTDPATGLPTGARVQPIYFFYDKAGRPLFSRPAHECRNQADHMQGGLGVLNPNPKDFCNPNPQDNVCPAPGTAPPCDPANMEKALAEKKKAYPVRTRDPWNDPERGGNDYQRPIIDISPGETTPNKPFYTGLWEIIEVTAPDGYKPDTIKSWATLKRGIDQGKFKLRRTEKAINCPIVDEQTNVVVGVSDRTLFHPVIELWYRRKMGTCYLANGWETLGDAQGNLYHAGPDSDGSRLDTFDVDRINVGHTSGNAAPDVELSVPVKNLYVPAVIVPNQDPSVPSVRVRMIDNFLSDAVPRRTPDDPPGYTPIKWLWDISVPMDYKVGSITSISQAANFAKAPRVQDSQIVTENFPIRGSIAPCSFPRDPTSGVCEEDDVIPDPGQRTIVVVAGDKFEASGMGMMMTKIWTFQNGTFTADDVGKFLRVSGASHANLNDDFEITDLISPTQIATNKASLFMDANESFDPATVKAVVFDKSKEKHIPKVDPACAALNLECNKDTCSCDSPAVGYGKVCGPGIARCGEEKDAFSEFGYSCFPAPVASNKGFCYIGCDVTTPNKEKNDDPTQPFRDSRCKSLPYYKCFGFRSTPAKHRFCLRADCDLTITDPMSTNCQALAQKLADDGTLEPDETNIAEGQTCQDYGIAICAWPEDYEPK